MENLISEYCKNYCNAICKVFFDTSQRKQGNQDLFNILDFKTIVF